MLKKIVFLLFLLPLSSFADVMYGQTINDYGHDYIKSMNHIPLTSDENFKSSFLMGYIAGVIDATSEIGMYCLPSSSTMGMIIDLTLKYAKLHPEKSNERGRYVVIEAMQNSFRCSDPPKWLKDEVQKNSQ